MSTEPLRIMTIGEWMLYALGHQDKERFAREASGQYGIPDLEASEVQHVHLHETPAPKESGWDVYVDICEPDTPDSYPATVVDVS